jgi:hypothetical protein
MSWVNNWVILPHRLDKGKLDTLNVILEEDEGVEVFVRVDKECGGTKYLEADVWVCAANYISKETLGAAVSRVPWEKPESLLVLLCGDEDDSWRLVTFQYL